MGHAQPIAAHGRAGGDPDVARWLAAPRPRRASAVWLLVPLAYAAIAGVFAVDAMSRRATGSRLHVWVFAVLGGLPTLGALVWLGIHRARRRRSCALAAAGARRGSGPQRPDGADASREVRLPIGRAVGSRSAGRAAALAVVFLVWTPLAVLAATVTAAGGPPSIFAPLVGLPVLVLVTLAALRRLSMGRLVVELPDAAVRPGETLDLRVGVSEGGARIDDVRFVLRRVREVSCAGAAASRRLVEDWSCDAVVEQGAHLGPERFHVVRFDVAADAPGTALRTGPGTSVYWELLVLGRVGGRAYGERVMVPIYARPAP